MQSGFLYYYDALGLDRASYRLHYPFSETTGSVITDQSSYGLAHGNLSSVGNFHAISGSGFFTGQKLTIQNSTGLSATDWTHLFIFERTDPRQGVLFDSYTSGAVHSGYRIGVNDNNRFYFESYDNEGRVSRTSKTLLGNKNCAAVVKSQDLVTFYCFDFNNNDAISDSVDIRGQYTLFSSNAVIGSTRTGTDPFRGYIDEYVYLAQGLNPSALKLLVSGPFSTYQLESPIISGFLTTGIIGYASGVTGVTGILGYENVLTGSGIDVFGNPENYYTNSPVTGYLVSGLYVTPITGTIQNYITGDPIETLTLHSERLPAFGMNEVSFTRKFYSADATALNLYPQLGGSFNKRALFDYVEGEFQLDRIYTGQELQLSANGVLQENLGSYPTGDFYNSGNAVSGDFYLDSFYAVGQGNLISSDLMSYDFLSGAVISRADITGHGISGRSEGISPGADTSIYLNGVRLISGLDYSVYGGSFHWFDNKYSGVTGVVSQVNYTGLLYWTGTYPTGLPLFPRSNTQLYLNGQRQILGLDYVENSSLDLIKQSGIFETGLNSVYNNETTYFE